MTLSTEVTGSHASAAKVAQRGRLSAKAKAEMTSETSADKNEKRNKTTISPHTYMQTPTTPCGEAQTPSPKRNYQQIFPRTKTEKKTRPSIRERAIIF